jgi:hypothetical protein
MSGAIANWSKALDQAPRLITRSSRQATRYYLILPVLIALLIKISRATQNPSAGPGDGWFKIAEEGLISSSKFPSCSKSWWYLTMNSAVGCRQTGRNAFCTHGCKSQPNAIVDFQWWYPKCHDSLLHCKRRLPPSLRAHCSSLCKQIPRCTILRLLIRSKRFWYRTDNPSDGVRSDHRHGWYRNQVSLDGFHSRSL